jgi:cytochrome c oxidase assembly protein subunit 17
MGQGQSAEVKKTPTCKICCACPEERRKRDECFIFNNADKCREQIDGFYACLLKEGFSQEQVDSLRKSAAKNTA